MGFEEKLDKSDLPTIPEYYKGKHIFVTGGSGFMGQALVEKLLYSCPELDSIYLLMRGKKGVPPEERLEMLYSSSCFDRLRDEKPTIFKEKVHVISGDLMELGLGLSKNNRALLINKINIVFHGAASVRFDDPLKYAAKLNIRGTREIIELAKEMKNITSFVHVSTCYSNTKHKVIEEVLYPPLADWRELLEVCETMDEMTLQTLTAKYLNGMPNTYVFTKQLAEHLVSEQRGKLPVVIIRPSIVISSMNEPAPGWINNFNGPVGLSVAVATGLKYSMYATDNAVLNYIPLDVCIKSFIVMAWARGIARLQDTDDVQIYNCCVSKEDTIRLSDFGLTTLNISKDMYPLHARIWDARYPTITSVFTFYFIITLLCSILPAIILDFTMRVLGKKPRFITLQRKIYIADLLVHYYISSKNWIMNNENFLNVRKIIKDEDRSDFYYSTEKLYESDYLANCTMGAKKYLLNEDVNDMSQARANLMRLIKLQRKIFIADQALYYFTSRQWEFKNTNFLKIRDTLKPEDRTPFYYKIEGYYTDEHMEACLYAGRKYLLRENVDDVIAVEKARAHAQRMMVLDKIVSVLFYGALLWWLINTKYIKALYYKYL